MLSTVRLDRLGDKPHEVLAAQCVRGPQSQAEQPMETQEGRVVFHLLYSILLSLSIISVIVCFQTFN